MKISSILETCICADDLAAAERFYTEVLGLQVFAKKEGRHVFFRLDQAMFLVFNPENMAEPSQTEGGIIPGHGTRGAGHVCFRVGEGEIPVWRQRLQSKGVEIESEVVWGNGGTSLYFRDPAGNCLEIAPSKIWDTPEIGD